MKELNWNQFNEAVTYIVEQCKYKKFTGVYGFPRGGLCLAVTVSHYLDIPFLIHPKEGCLVVDDIYDSGETMSELKNIKDAEFYVWISKKHPSWWNCYEFVNNDEWIIFPWEDASQAVKNMEEHYVTH